jgi:hypothetical protein
VLSTGDCRVSFSKPGTFWANVFFGSRWNPDTQGRAAFDLIPTTDGIRIVATLQLISNPGSAFEQATDMSSGKDAETCQTLLNETKAKFTPTPLQ